MAGVNPRSLARFLKQAAGAAGLRGEIDVLITGDREIRNLNRQYRGKNQVTDVLSFPAKGPTEVTGDIAICGAVALENARRLGHSPEEELKILLLHGVLHLAGYDHEKDNGRMRRKEERLRRKLMLPNSLIHRSTTAHSEKMPRNPKST